MNGSIGFTQLMKEGMTLAYTLVQELRVDDTGRHSQYIRMMVENFDIILGLVEPHLRRQDTVMQLAIEPALKLAVTLHHLAEGASHVAIAVHYSVNRVAHNLRDMGGVVDCFAATILEGTIRSK